MKLWQKTGALGIFSFSCRRPLSSRSRYFGGSGTTASCRCYYYFCSRDRENNRGAKEEAEAHNTAWLQQRYQLLSLLLTQTPKVFYSSTKIFKVHFPSMNNSFPLACCCLVKIQFYSRRKIAWDVNFWKFDLFLMNLSICHSLKSYSKILRIFQAFFQVKSGLEKIVKSNKV